MGLARMWASDMTQCRSLCDSTAGCAGFAFRSDQCCLKKGLASLPSNESAQPGTNAPKKKCCGKKCYPGSPEYDPDTEQCCGEGESDPVVCGLGGTCPPLEFKLGLPMSRLCPLYGKGPWLRCCRYRNCLPSSQRYDPMTHQCCGGGHQISAEPTVCRRDFGCCRSYFTKSPQCFDVRTEQCCGHFHGRPLVCGSGVTCPSPSGNGNWACPSLSTSTSLRGAAPGSRAIDANYSSFAEQSAQLLP